MNYAEFGYVRMAAFAPPMLLADPSGNVARIAECIEDAAARRVSVVLFPELALTGYSCEDLFFDRQLQRGVDAALKDLVQLLSARQLTVVVGAPIALADARLFNCAVVLSGDGIKGIVPKQSLPNYDEFYEHRWFTPGTDVDAVISIGGCADVPVHPNLLFEAGSDFCFGVEICEDLWAVQPTGAALALAGADVILNPSASTELVAKADYRRDLVRISSAQRHCAYLYASSGVDESTKDVVFGGHLIACENGALLAESERFAVAGSTVTVEFDIDLLRHQRQSNATYRQAPRTLPVRRIAVAAQGEITALERRLTRHPFVPGDEHELDARASEILEIQSAGLARRLRSTGLSKLVIGLSGGLDSTLAHLVALQALARNGLGPEALHAITAPGPGTSEHTLRSARDLAAATSVTLEEISIERAVQVHLQDLDHEGGHDVVFENAQARERTQIFFNKANQLNALLVGTGDLSELALGWCTFNADHMASYNVNAGVPKTLVRYLIRWYERHHADAPLAEVLGRVRETPISPELIPAGDESVGQVTEDIVGPYELHDFFLYLFLRHGARPAKILALAELTFAGLYDAQTLKKWLRVFLQRFFAQQFKRTTLPPGPKVGTVSLSPRGDWRMPDEASARAWLAELNG